MLNRIAPLGLTGLLAPGLVFAEDKALDPMSGAYLGQMFFGLLIVIGLIVILSFLVKRYGQINPLDPQKLKVISSLALGQRERLVVVEIGGKQVALGVAPGHVSHLMDLDEPLQTGTDSKQELAGIPGLISAWIRPSNKVVQS